jgi:hypothetical protein
MVSSCILDVSFTFNLAEFSFVLDERINLIHEDCLTLCYCRLNIHDLLVNKLVDLLHVLEHCVGFLIQHVQLVLVLLKFLLLFKDLSATVHAAKLAHIRVLTHLLQSLIDVARLRSGLTFSHNLGILQLFVDLSKGLGTLATARFSKLFDVAGERFSKHLGVKARELFEDSLKHELLSQSECLHLGQGHIVEL